MRNLDTIFKEKYTNTDVSKMRNFTNEIDFSDRLIGIKGSRGVGKTTILLQYLKKNFKLNNKIMYVSLDHIHFSNKLLYDYADEFRKKGGELLILDEVHRYANWSKELKNIYDDFTKLKVIFTGSSLLHLRKAQEDLSRRAAMYSMPGLSFREYLEFETNIQFPIYKLTDIIENHVDISLDIITKIKPLSHFHDYLSHGYYPFYLSSKKSFHRKLNEAINLTLEVDIPQFENIPISNIIYLKRLLHIISKSVPFKPNYNKISQRTELSINSVKSYIIFLERAKLISQLHLPDKGLGNINKPEKIFLDNTNIMYNLAPELCDVGNLRETFFMSQISSAEIDINASKDFDFIIDNKYNFEIGGKNKKKKQINGIENSYIVKDNIEIGDENIIPLWMFGFMY